MRTYEQDLKELNISEDEFYNIISHIYDKTADEMAVLAKAIKSGARVLPAVKRAFERVLAMRQAERQEAYTIYYNDLNTMCYSCKAGSVDHALMGGLAVSIVAGDTWLFCDFGVRKTEVVFDNNRKAELLGFYGL